jgi:phosphoribosyl 1,2-cyclic phosphodiesterase
VKETTPQPEIITFLGTGGARFVMISQLLATGGIWLSLGGTEILVDPGPGSLVGAVKRKLNPEKLAAIIISHRHLDHSGDANVMVEAMTGGGFKKRGRLFVPADALDSEPVVYSFLRGHTEGVEILAEGKSYRVGNVSFQTPLRHIHGVETYGFNFDTGRHNFSYISDTRYFDALSEEYRGELLIINAQSRENRPFLDHLSVADTERIITAVKPKIAILTHFGMTMWRGRPWQVTEEMSQKTGIKVVSARDGMRFDLAGLDA